MNKKGWMVIGVVAVIILLIVFLPSGEEVQAPVDDQIVEIEVNADNMGDDTVVAGDDSDAMPMDEASTTAYAVEEITLHGAPEDCWLSINGKVYDVTSYIADGLHPGGEAILNGCGLEDATPLFTGIKEGEGHPENAWNYLENFYIGDVAVAE